MYIPDIQNGGSIGPVGGKIEQSEQTKRNRQVENDQTDFKSTLDKSEIARHRKEDARVLNAAKMVFDSLPEVREDKVELARQRLEQGYYESPEVRGEIAAKMVDDPEASPNMPLTDRETETIRSRLKGTYYDQSAIRDSIARSMIDDALDS